MTEEKNVYYRMIPKSAGTLFALIVWAKFSPVGTPRIKMAFELHGGAR